ncbi:MAG: DUF1223 domain-containing protein [Betaproteobacteria bacterium]|nr:DUF1223 domain-containing protein [Betaproteobacteria bacterium]
MPRILKVLAAGIAAMAFSAAASGQCMKQSPVHTVALVELYTSEGCDSCPPADRWLSGLGGHPAPDSMVPLSLHVDYWDTIGWKDRFADARFTARQRELASLARGTVVYTPEVFVGLHELRNWRSEAGMRDALRRINATPARASIRIELGKPGTQGIEIQAAFRLVSGTASPGVQAFLALYENGLSTQVKAGENRGVTLKHDAVVRQWIGPLPLEHGAADLKRTLPLPPGAVAKNLGVAAFVQNVASRDVLQATALQVCSPVS